MSASDLASTDQDPAACKCDVWTRPGHDPNRVQIRDQRRVEMSIDRDAAPAGFDCPEDHHTLGLIGNRDTGGKGVFRLISVHADLDSQQPARLRRCRYRAVAAAICLRCCQGSADATLDGRAGRHNAEWVAE